MSWGNAQISKNQNVLLLSLADIEGPSGFTGWEPLLLISRPWKRPRGSCCIASEKPWTWLAASIWAWWFDMLGWRWLYWGILVLWDSFCAECCWCAKKPDWLYGTWCIPRLYASEVPASSPVAILSLSTSCFSASFKAAN